MTSMLERAARAIRNADYCGEPLPDDQALEAVYYDLTRAALRALREPDKAMLMAMQQHLTEDTFAFDAKCAWQAAIDAILADQPAEEGR